MKTTLVVSAALAFVAVAAQVRDPAPSRPHPRGYVALRTVGPSAALIIDGRLDDAAWAQAAWSDEFVDIEGDVKPRPTWPTRVKMLWDDAFFYVAAELREPHIWATFTKHDSIIFHENDFEVFLDPDGDNREYYEFEINALGTYWDLRLPKPYRDGGKAVDNWEIPGLKSAVALDGTLNNPSDTDRSWSVELAFPWAALKQHTTRPAPPRDGDQWRINFSRVQWDLAPAGGGYAKTPKRAEHNWVWSPQGAIDMHRPEMWGYVQFSTATTASVRFVPNPTWPARAWLYDAYYAQRAFRQKHGRFAGSLSELGLDDGRGSELSAHELVPAGDDRYTLSVVVSLPGGRRETWHMNHESAVWAGVPRMHP